MNYLLAHALGAVAFSLLNHNLQSTITEYWGQMQLETEM